MFQNPGLDPTSAAGGQGLAGFSPPGADEFDPAILNATPTELDDGGVELSLDDEGDGGIDPRDAPHDANLVELLDEADLNRIAQELIEGIEADVDSNDEYYAILAAGTKLLGLKPSERKNEPFAGASAAVHPLLKEAVVRCCANVGGELMPADGPAKCRVFGDSTVQKEQQAQRKALYLNYYLTEEDEEYADDFDQMILLLGLYGSMFRKVSRDPLRNGAPTSRHYSPYDIIVSHHATTMHGSYRVTHIEPMAPSAFKRLQLRGWFADIDVSTPSSDSTPARTQQQDREWRRPTELPDDTDHVLMHCHCELDVPGLEHLDPEGSPSGLHLPYIVSIEAESQKVVRIARNYDAGDTAFRPREYYVHYRYMPGLGFYGWGLIHLVGGDTDTLSVLRRQGINAISLYTFPGGLKKKGMAGETMDLRVGPGQFKDVDTGGASIQDTVMPMPYRDVPTSYPEIVGEILSSGQRVASTGDVAVGDANENAAPGTVLALIRQNAKLESAVVKRCHRAQRKELRLLADLFGSMDQATYPYMMNGQNGMALKADFADNADVCPVADPNVPTQTERLANAQATITIAGQSGGIVQMRAAIEDFLRVMGKTDADLARLMPPPNAGMPADPITEFATALQGGPLKADPAQDHVSHVQAHIGQLATPGLMGAPPGNALSAHIAEHTAMFYAAEAQRMGAPAPQPPAPPGPPGAPPPPGAGPGPMPAGVPGAPPSAPPVPPQQLDAQIAKAVAAASAQLRVTMQQLAPPQQGQGGDPNDAAKVALEREKLAVQQQDQARKSEETARQDAIEVKKLAATMADNEKQRHVDLLKGEQQIEVARLKGRSQTASDAIGHATAVTGAHADIHVSNERTEQARHAAKAAEAQRAAAAAAASTASAGGDAA